MTRQVLTIPGELPTLNEVIEANRTNRYVGSKQKKRADADVVVSAKVCKIKPVKRADFIFHWYCKDRRKDKDNIASARKFIFDGLVKAGILKNDGWKEIGIWEDLFYIDKDNPRIEVVIVGE